MEIPERSETGAIFNGATATLQRIDFDLKTAAEGYIQGNLLIYFRGISCAYKELRPFVNNSAEKTKLDNMEKAIESAVLTYTRTPKHTRQNISSPNPIVREFEVGVRDALHEAGLLMPKGDDPRFSLGG